MIYCINKESIEYQSKLKDLSQILESSSAAVTALELNNGNSLDRAPNGNISNLFYTYYNHIIQKNPEISEIEAIKYASKKKLETLLKESIVFTDENGEPIIILDNFFEHQRDIHPKYDQKLLEYFKDNYKVSVRIPISDFIKKIKDNPTYQNIYNLLATLHKRNEKDSLLKGVSVVLDYPDRAFNQAYNLRAPYKGARAYYNASNQEIHINAGARFNNGESDSVIWHEILHALTVSRLSNKEARDRFQKILDRYQEVHNNLTYIGPNGLEEFVADIWSNPDLIDQLKNIYVEKTSSLWDSIKEWIINAFGLTRDDSLFAQASAELELLLQDRTVYPQSGTYFESGLDQDTRDIIGLMFYQYSKEGLTQEEIKDRVKAYISQDKSEISRVRKFIDLVQIRQAQLHTLGRDLGEEKVTESGNFDWNNYLKGIDLRENISEESDIERFPIIEDYIIDPAEIIMPKLYKTQFKLGNQDIADIDVNYFKKVNPYYNSELKNKGIKVDFLVRTHSSKFNICVQDTLQAPIQEMKRVYPKIEDGWRLDIKGNRLYKIPESLKYAIYVDQKGVETLVVLNSSSNQDIKSLIQSTQNIVSVQLFADNIEPSEDWISFVIQQNNIKTNNPSLYKLLKEFSTLSNDEIRERLYNIYTSQKKYYQNDLANTLYNSFVKTLYAISVRIPTQAFQSIMAVKVAALTNDDDNNVFVTRWQFWLQGSDLDIDKSYIMGCDISSIGTYNHWSPLADYSTETLAKISDKLPLPKMFSIASGEDIYKIKGTYKIIQEPKYGEYSKLEDLVQNYLVNLDEDGINKKELKLQTLVDILNYINKEQRITLSEYLLKDPQVQTLIKLINQHNTHQLTAAESRNIIQKNIIDASLDERNMKASYSPIDEAMGKFQDELKKIEDQAALERDLDDGGLSIARMQYNNSVGKKDVGIMANGLKAFFALTQYFNKHKNDPNYIESTRYFLTRINLGKGKDKYFSSISDIQFENNAVATLKYYFKLFNPELSGSLTFTNEDASLLLSSLTSLATDNAKELALAKMNASIDLACIHIFLVVMGYSPQEIIEFTTGKAFTSIVKELQKSALSSKKLNVKDAIAKSIKDIESQNTEESNQKVKDLLNIQYIYDCAQEMSTIAKIAGINQGVKVDELNMDSFYNLIQKVISNQGQTLNDYLGENNSFKLKDGIIEFNGDLDESIKKFIQIKHNIENPSQEFIDFIKNKLNKLNEENIKYRYFIDSFDLNLERYYSDPNYKAFAIELYDFLKFNFNVLDCFSNLKHFDKMLEAFVLSTKVIKDSSSRARAILDYSRKAYSQGVKVHPYIIETIDPLGEMGEPISFNKKVFNIIPFNESIQRKASRYYDDYILSEWIQEFGKDIHIKYGDVEIQLKNNEDLAKYANFIAFELIPLLKELYPKNTFLKYIRPDFKKLRKKSKDLFLPRYEFNFDVDKLTSISDQNKAFYINKGFAEIGKLTLKDLNIENLEIGNSLKIGELLYLYDKIVNLSSVGQGSLERAFELYSEQNLEKDTIAKQIAKIIQEHDLRIRPEIEFDPIKFTAFCYAQQIRTKQKGIMTYNYDWKAKEGETYDISGIYLFNLQEVEHFKNTQILLDQFLDQYRRGNIEIDFTDGTWTIQSKSDPDLVYTFGGKDFSLESFGKDIYSEYKNNKEELQEFLNSLLNTIPIKAAELKNYQTKQLYSRFAERMKDFNIQVELISDKDKPNGYIKDGIIYLNYSTDITTTPMHELMHLFLEAMKTDNFNEFERLLNLVMQSPAAKKIDTELLSSEDYSNLMELDRYSETLCRLIEGVINGTINQDQAFIDSQENDSYITISKLISPYISKVLGVYQPTELLSFLHSTISTIPTYGSNILMPIKSDSTGFLTYKEKIIQSSKVSNFIQKLVKDNLLTETEC